MAHAITLQSPLGDKLRFARMRAREQLGRLYTFELEAISRSPALDLKAMLGMAMSVKVTTPKGYVRHYHGIVSEVEQTGFEYIKDLRYAVYALVLVPKPWLLTQRRDCRIFKNKSVPELVRLLLSEAGYTDVKLSLTGSYKAREYCVQYRESDFDFISRLMEQEGIYYYFTHTASTHTMVLADALGAHSANAPFARVPYCPPGQKGSRMKDSITDWSLGRSAHSKRVRLNDYDYLKPRASLQVAEEPAEACGGSVGELDVYDYPGAYEDLAVGRRYAQVRAEALNVPQARFSGQTDACGLAVGALFKLKDFPLAEYNQEYLVVQAETVLVEVDYVSGESATCEPYFCTFSALRSRQPFRTAQTTPWPRIAGLQTAVVHGKTPEDIEVDQYGRVEVDFFWSPPGKPRADSSCPVRVASYWAGRRWGAVHIPRVGQEVVVSFLEGNPDRPLIIGSVYNADHMPPYPLPAQRTRSGVRSRSHPRGGPEDYNEISFEDRKGKEELLLHAQRDMRHESENDHLVDTKRDETGEIGRNREWTVGRDDTLKVGRKLRIEAGNEIELVTGAARLVMKRSGEISISGTRLTFDARIGFNVVAGAAVDIKSGAAFTVMANGAVMVQSNAVATVRANATLLLQATGPAILKGSPPLLA
ncbi:type VI secretion system Vgr family protein [Lysobacter enzymogenes]|uniref:type VI secretion system Vgr family protein n=1 Tax=Lysobacter enzymogenes TaxID=69 RepID=UPI001AF52657|nr:type VI secretion system tip protein TssI/VgrG [Lysobacter enzymogenes]QQQ03708.1 type VI secretion system tip protein VgrG [Lysobacter enzymogenes]